DAIDDPVRQAHVREIEAWCQRTFAARHSAFIARKRDGFVRECHGDLHLGNMVLLDDAVVIFDCLEFNDALRWIDVASDGRSSPWTWKTAGGPTWRTGS